MLQPHWINLINRFSIKKFHDIGLDGFAMLGLSNLVIAASLGLSLLIVLLHTAWVAFKTPATVKPSKWVWVPGVQLVANLPSADYRLRLRRAKSLYNKFKNISIVVLGGITGKSCISEAEAGKEYLLAHGLPESDLSLEQESSHTLENLRFAQAMVCADMSEDERPVVLISNRYHLARCRAMAKKLSIPHQLCAAEDRLIFSLRNVMLIFKEAYHLHWYLVGCRWARITNNQKMLMRLQ
jgi:uncharacterized SAM-binding protein YcdF (DUF218 family)